MSHRSAGPLLFDSRGVDFAAWINHFKDQVCRNWKIPESVTDGTASGHVDLEFRVLGVGKVANVRTLRSSSSDALDEAARNALTDSKLLPLPQGFPDPEVVMQISFWYNTPPGK